MGNYTVQVTLNAALEASAYLVGASNGTLATAQPLDGSFQPLSSLGSATRGAVLGSTTSSSVTFASWNMNTNPGWTMQGQWAWGQPTGGGGLSYGYPDPTSGYTGTNVCGVNLSGDYSTTVGGPYYLITSAINCSGQTGVQLSFERWLNSDYRPMSRIRSTCPTTAAHRTNVYANPSTGAMTDDSWQLETYNISAVANNQPAVYIRWGYTRGGGHFALLRLEHRQRWLSGSVSPGGYYSVNLNAGDAITAGLNNLSGSGTAISLLSPTGATLASGASGPTNLSQVINGYSIPATGKYYLLVSGTSAAAYDMVVTRNAAFSLLPHGTSATAQALGSGIQAVLGNVGATGASTSVVVPNANATVEGDSNNGFPFNLANVGGGASQRYQQIYSATQFASGGVINALKFRLASGASPFSTTGINVEISLGYAATTVATASATFANNDGPNMVTVYDGLLSLSSTSTTSPSAFDIVINVAPLFNYNPALGDLLVDMSMLNSPSTAQFDAVDASNTAVARIWGGLTSATGTVDLNTAGLVTDFSFLPQEANDWYSINVPAACALLVLSTSTPGGGPGGGSGEFENGLSPLIQLYNPSGVLVATGTVEADRPQRDHQLRGAGGGRRTPSRSAARAAPRAITSSASERP